MLRRLLAFLLLLPALLGAGSCSQGTEGPSPEDAISKEVFMEAFFQLRLAALQNPDREIRPQQRDRILQELGLTQDDLLNFVDVWGAETGFMQEVWDSIEERMRRTRDAPFLRAPESPDALEEEDPGTANSRRVGPGGRGR